MQMDEGNTLSNGEDTPLSSTPGPVTSSISSSGNWRLFGRRLPKSEVTFFAQVIIIYIIIITCVVNISLGNGDNNLWVALLSSSIGYLLPSPSLK